MYKQANIKRSLGYQHWRNQERLDELEKLLESEYSSYIDPAIAANIKKVIKNRKQQYSINNL